MPRHRGPRSLKRWARRVLPLAAVSVAAVVLWAAALTAAARCEDSPNRVMLHAASPEMTHC